MSRYGPAFDPRTVKIPSLHPHLLSVGRDIAFRDVNLGTTVPPVDALFIDIGATSRVEAEQLGVEPGQQVTWDRDLA